jgi:hypothetical protein
MNALEELKQKAYDDLTPLEKMIVSARFGEMMQGWAAEELKHLRAKELEGISAYDIANAAVDELFKAGDGTTANRLELKDENERSHGGWAKRPARDIILKHINAALKK